MSDLINPLEQAAGREQQIRQIGLNNVVVAHYLALARVNSWNWLETLEHLAIGLAARNDDLTKSLVDAARKSVPQGLVEG